MYTVPEVLERLPVSKSTLYTLLRRGDLPRIKVGHRTYVPATALTTYLEGRNSAPQEQSRSIRHTPTCSFLVFHNRPCDCPAGQSREGQSSPASRRSDHSA
jgi:excisionase family DNA binding protein